MHKSLIRAFLIISILLKCSVSLTAQPSSLEGDWRGDIDLGTVKMPLVFSFSYSENSELLCKLASPMQGVGNIPVDIVYCMSDSLSLIVKSIGASYNAKVSSGQICGVFSQRGYSFPLILSPDQPLTYRRPQTPRPPFPYTTIDTIFKSFDDTVLSGTLTIPDSLSTNAPVVVMVTGSGPQNRDEELFDHRPFAVIADYLARNGVASFRYDDRGVGLSKGDFASSDISTFLSDAEAAIAFVNSFGKFNRVGILGHSEGATIALNIGAKQIPDFVISMAAAADDGKDLIIAQNKRLLDRLQLTEKQRNDVVSLISQVFDYIIAGRDFSAVPVDEIVAEQNLDVNPLVLSSIKKNISNSKGNYFRSLLSLKPSDWLSKITCPVLAINGTLDTQVDCNTNLKIISDLLPKAVIKSYPGLNHLFQHATTGDIVEYNAISETISPEVLADLISFICRR